MTTLDAQLLDAHDRDDVDQLIALYTQAADLAQDDNATGFFLTQAYVFALEASSPRADHLHARLVAMGRDAAF